MVINPQRAVHERAEEEEAGGPSVCARVSALTFAHASSREERKQHNLPMHVIELRIVHAWAEQKGGERGVLGREEEDGRELGEGEEACVCVG
jgi:hypothetical protein